MLPLRENNWTISVIHKAIFATSKYVLTIFLVMLFVLEKKTKSPQIRVAMGQRIIEYLTRATESPCLKCEGWRILFCPAQHTGCLTPIIYVCKFWVLNPTPFCIESWSVAWFETHGCIYTLEIEILCKQREDNNVFYAEHLQNSGTFCRDRSTMATWQVFFITKTAHLFHLYLQLTVALTLDTGAKWLYVFQRGHIEILSYWN